MDLTTKAGKSTIEVELRKEQILSNVLGLPLDTPKPIYFEYPLQYSNGVERVLFRGMAAHGYQLQRWGVDGGVSLHHSSDLRYKIKNHPIDNGMVQISIANRHLLL